MKHLFITLLVITLSITGVIAQSATEKENYHEEIYHEQGDWIIGLGVNVVDDSGWGFKELFNAKDNWNFGNPFQAMVEYRASTSGSVQASFSINKYIADKDVDDGMITEGFEPNYFAFDVNAKYSFSEVLKWNQLEPYILIGVGYTYISEYHTYNNTYVFEDKGRVTLNTGLGVNYWFSRTWGVNLNLVGKFGIGEYESGIKVTNQKQYSLGVLYSI